MIDNKDNKKGIQNYKRMAKKKYFCKGVYIR